MNGRCVKVCYLVFVFMMLHCGSIFSQSVKFYEGTIEGKEMKMVLNYTIEDYYNVWGIYYYPEGGIHFVEGLFYGAELLLADYGEKLRYHKRDPIGHLKVVLDKGKGYWRPDDRNSNVRKAVSFSQDSSKMKWNFLDTSVCLTTDSSLLEHQVYQFMLQLQYPNDSELLNSLMAVIYDVDKMKGGTENQYLDKFIRKQVGANIDSYNNIDSLIVVESVLMSKNGSVVFLSESTLSYMIKTYYTGDGNTQPVYNYYVFDLKKMKQIGFRDVFVKRAGPLIAEIIYEKSGGNHRLKSIESNLDNFYLLENGVGFFFNEGEISNPYHGPFNYFIPWEEIKRLRK